VVIEMFVDYSLFKYFENWDFDKVLNKGLGLGLWCLTTLLTMFQLYRGGPFYLFIYKMNSCRIKGNLLAWLKNHLLERKQKMVTRYSSSPLSDVSQGFVLAVPLTLCDKVCQWLATCLWFPPGTPFAPPIKLTATI
jgi:hypothetical protein